MASARRSSSSIPTSRRCFQADTPARDSRPRPGKAAVAAPAGSAGSAAAAASSWRRLNSMAASSTVASTPVAAVRSSRLRGGRVGVSGGGWVGGGTAASAPRAGRPAAGLALAQPASPAGGMRALAALDASTRSGRQTIAPPPPASSPLACMGACSTHPPDKALQAQAPLAQRRLVGAGPRQPALDRLQHQLLPREQGDAEEGVHGCGLLRAGVRCCGRRRAPVRRSLTRREMRWRSGGRACPLQEGGRWGGVQWSGDADMRGRMDRVAGGRPGGERAGPRKGAAAGPQAASGAMAAAERAHRHSRSPQGPERRNALG